MTVTYPFTRATPAGHATGQILLSTEFDHTDETAAAGADGSLWTDVALVKNWQTLQTVADYGLQLIWSPAQLRWFTVGVSAGNPVVKWSPVGGTAWVANNPAASVGLTPIGAAIATDGEGLVMVGGTPGSASTAKLRLLTETLAGGTWTTVNVNENTVAAVRCLAYFEAGGFWLAGLSNTAATNIERSSNGTTFTQVTGLPNTNPRRAIACGVDRVVVIAAASTDKCLMSQDCVTFTEETLPSSAQWLAITYNAVLAKFFVLSGSAVASSEDGETWSTSGLTIPSASTPELIVSLGRLLIICGNTGDGTHHGVWVSSDGAETWQLVRIDTNSTATLASSGQQIAWATNGGDDHHFSFAGGF